MEIACVVKGFIDVSKKANQTETLMATGITSSSWESSKLPEHSWCKVLLFTTSWATSSDSCSMHPVHVTFHNTRCAVFHAVDSALIEK